MVGKRRGVTHQKVIVNTPIIINCTARQYRKTTPLLMRPAVFRPTSRVTLASRNGARSVTISLAGDSLVVSRLRPYEVFRTDRSALGFLGSSATRSASIDYIPSRLTRYMVAAAPPIWAASLVAGFAPVISLSVCVASPGRAPVTHLDQGCRKSILRSSLCPWPLGPRKTIGSRPCPSDIQLQVLWFLTITSQARDLGSSVRQRLMNLCCPLDETAANQAFWLEANPSSGSPSHPSSHPNNLAGSNST